MMVSISHLCATIIVDGVTLQVSVVLHVSGIIKFTFMRSTAMIFIFNVNTDTVVIPIAKKLTIIQILDQYGLYRVAH